jgi:nucleoside-diphosphate-sugar epimerase
MRIAVTGANGFVGTALLHILGNQGHEVVPCVRRRGVLAEALAVGEINSKTDWSKALATCDVVIHLAARVHVMRDMASDPIEAYRVTNVDGTLALARQAAIAGVKRFIFLSSVKVLGESTLPGCPFAATDVPAPQNAYGASKLEAEVALREIATQTGMELVIIRPPLVYGPGVKANFLALMQAVGRGVPMPLAALDNRRSLLALDNLVDLIAVCARHPAAAGQTLLVSDGEDLSTPELIRRLGRAMGRTAQLFWVPVWLLWLAATLLGKRDVMLRLAGNMQIDIAATRERLDWTPPISIDEGLRRAVAGLKA